jgi:hypothetical protein
MTAPAGKTPSPIDLPYPLVPASGMKKNSSLRDPSPPGGGGEGVPLTRPASPAPGANNPAASQHAEIDRMRYC